MVSFASKGEVIVWEKEDQQYSRHFISEFSNLERISVAIRILGDGTFQA
jgi:hypothetical protein